MNTHPEPGLVINKRINKKRWTALRLRPSEVEEAQGAATGRRAAAAGTKNPGAMGTAKRTAPGSGHGVVDVLRGGHPASTATSCCHARSAPNRFDERPLSFAKSRNSFATPCPRRELGARRDRTRPRRGLRGLGRLKWGKSGDWRIAPSLTSPNGLRRQADRFLVRGLLFRRGGLFLVFYRHDGANSEEESVSGRAGYGPRRSQVSHKVSSGTPFSPGEDITCAVSQVALMHPRVAYVLELRTPLLMMIRRRESDPHLLDFRCAPRPVERRLLSDLDARLGFCDCLASRTTRMHSSPSLRAF